MIDSNVVVAMFAVAMGAVWFVHQDLKADISGAQGRGVQGSREAGGAAPDA